MMGLYWIPCRKCEKTFYWFSGNMDQRCPDCIKAEQEACEHAWTLVTTSSVITSQSQDHVEMTQTLRHQCMKCLKWEERLPDPTDTQR